jgi:hypothetical protein
LPKKFSFLYKKSLLLRKMSLLLRKKSLLLRKKSLLLRKGSLLRKISLLLDEKSLFPRVSCAEKPIFEKARDSRSQPYPSVVAIVSLGWLMLLLNEIALLTIQFGPDLLASCLFVEYPLTRLERRAMADVLIMAAAQQNTPIAVFVRVERDDRAFHGQAPPRGRNCT